MSKSNIFFCRYHIIVVNKQTGKSLNYNGYDDFYYDREICAREARIRQDAYEDDNHRTMIIINQERGTMPSLCALYFYCHEYVLKKYIEEKTTEEECKACTDDMDDSQHTCLNKLKQAKLDLILQSFTLAEASTFMQKVMKYMEVEHSIRDATTETLERFMISLGIADRAKDVIKDAIDNAVSPQWAIVLFKIPVPLLKVFSEVSYLSKQEIDDDDILAINC